MTTFDELVKGCTPEERDALEAHLYVLRLRGRLASRDQGVVQRTMTEMHHQFVLDHKSGVMVCVACGRGQAAAKHPCAPEA